MKRNNFGDPLTHSLAPSLGSKPIRVTEFLEHPTRSSDEHIGAFRWCTVYLHLAQSSDVQPYRASSMTLDFVTLQVSLEGSRAPGLRATSLACLSSPVVTFYQGA